MADNIYDAYVEQYYDNFILLSQQMKAKFDGTTRVRPITGDKNYWERLSEMDPTQSTVRHGETIHTFPEYSRRSAVPQDWYVAPVIDNEDRLKMLAMPDNDYLMLAVASLNRKKDDIIIDAFDADALSGHTGTTTTAFTGNGHDIAHGATGLTLAKITGARKALLESDVLMETELYLAISPYQLDELLQLEKFTSGDYGEKILRTGNLDFFCGFNIIVTNRLPESATGYRYCFAWAKEAMGLSIAAEPTVRIDELPTHRYMKQLFVSMSLGCVRVEDEKIVRIDCKES